MGFATRTLGDICDEVGGIVRTGPFGSQLHQSDYRDEGVPVVMPQNIIDGKVSVEGIARVGDKDATRLSQHKLRRGDIVYGRGGDIGRRALITSTEQGWLCGTGCLRISLRNSVLEPTFLHYYLGQPKVTAWILNQAVGATLPNLNTSIVRSIPITYPHIDTQRKIAAILLTYDNLIDNNSRRIKMLEEMAQLVYREWFVKFRFPGHENVRMVESEMGPIPEGWKVRNVTDVPCFRFVCENVTPYEGVKKYFATADVQGIEIVGEGITYTFERKPSRAQKQPPVDSVWFARMKDTYKVLVFTDVNERWAKECMLSSGFAGFQASDRGWLGYLYCTIKSDAFHEEKNRYCTGATQMSLTNEGLERIQVLAPDHRTAIAFNQLTAPAVNEILVLQALNAVLRRTRDLLLPKLISGELDVSELDIDVREEPA